MQTNQCFNNHWTFSASELCQAQVYRRNVYQRNGLVRVFPGAKGGREKFQGSEPWGVDLAQHMYYDFLRLIMICAKLQSYNFFCWKCTNGKIRRLGIRKARRKKGEKHWNWYDVCRVWVQVHDTEVEWFRGRMEKPNMFNVAGSERNRRCQATGGLGPCCDLVVISCGCQLVACQTHKTERKCLWMCSASKYFT